jgi:hypothetical protein
VHFRGPRNKLGGMKRAIAISAVSLAGLIAGAVVLVLLAPIAPLLPEGENVACFASRDKLGMRLWFGRPEASDPKPAVVDRFRLRLTRYGDQEPDAEQPHRRWHYSFRTTLTIRDSGIWSDGGQCDWTDDRFARHKHDLGCYQDCDGGGLWLYRVPFTRSLLLEWSFLAMQPHGAVSNRSRWPALIRLDPVPANECPSDEE